VAAWLAAAHSSKAERRRVLCSSAKRVQSSSVGAPSPAGGQSLAVGSPGKLGYIQYLSDVPELLVAIHILGATLVMIATTQLALDTRRPRSDASPDSVPDGSTARAVLG
jgi:cytochrome c oxidase assembly protein subunit 15